MRTTRLLRRNRRRPESSVPRASAVSLWQAASLLLRLWPPAGRRILEACGSATVVVTLVSTNSLRQHFASLQVTSHSAGHRTAEMPWPPEGGRTNDRAHGPSALCWPSRKLLGRVCPARSCLRDAGRDTLLGRR